MEVQDEQIEAEIQYLLTHNVVDTLMLSSMMDKYTKELAEYDCCL